jgi:F-box/leucine-rich repeat protein 2/20
MKTLTSLTGSVTKTDIVLIAQCFPFLEELDLDFPKADDRDTNILPLALPKLRKIKISGNCIFFYIIVVILLRYVLVHDWSKQH